MNLPYRFTLAILAISSSAFAGGGWIGSGGGTFKDEHNPWFLRNVSTVNYCIDLDTATFSASLDQSRAAIQDAIQYWQKQFSIIQKLSPSGQVDTTGAQVGTQTFNEVDCLTGNPDVRFVLGYGKLQQPELDFFKDPTEPSKTVTDYIGVTVRTSYDPVQLRGRGFVYISSDLGTHVYQNDGNLIAPAWSKPNLLRYALIHETGHVFGFPHTGTSIMSEVFLEQILEQHLTYLFQSNPIDAFLFPGPMVESCFLLPNQATWFNLPAGSDCVDMDLSDLRNIVVTTHPRNSKAAPAQLGMIKGLNISTLQDYRSRPGIFVHLTPAQTVFTNQETGFRAFMVGPSFVDFGAEANFVPTGGTARPVYLRFTSNSFTITGAALGSPKVGILFSYESPIDLLVTQH